MRKTLLILALAAVSACGDKQEEAPAADSAAALAPAPAPTASDTAAMMSHDSMAMPSDTMARDTASKQ